MTSITLASALIKTFEGCSLKAYQDTGGVWTIGFGHTHGVKAGDVITQQQAEDFLAQDSQALVTAIAGKSLIEGAALLSFGYNVGLGALRELLLSADVPTAMLNYTHDRRGNVLPGLVTRRNLESTLILASRAAATPMAATAGGLFK